MAVEEGGRSQNMHWLQWRRHETMMRQMGPMIQRFQTVCPDCQGEGEIMRERDRCKRCGGKKTIVERKVLRACRQGHEDRSKVDFRGEGIKCQGTAW
jgi:DnaJ family protein A protein 2